MKKLLALCCLAVLFGCGGGGNGGGNGASQSSLPAAATAAFWAVDFTTDPPTSYQTTAAKVAEGTHCYIYLEQGQSVSQAAIDAIKDEFDATIYPGDIAGFGSEPNPGIDSDPKVYILLLSARDGYSPFTSNSYLAGYFDPVNEYAQSQYPTSNQKEILYFNVNPATGTVPASIDFYANMAHEFQHMIHWERKTHQHNVEDETWLDEAMATVARTYCGYGPDYGSVLSFQHDPSHSLTSWDGTALNYGVVYMWAQYLKDRAGGNVFSAMLDNGQTGIASVNAALAAVGYPKDFTATFRDWTVANYVGNGTTVPVPQNNAAWSYASLNTWPGTYSFNNNQSSVTLPGMFPSSRQNRTTLDLLDKWSAGYYSYTPSPSSPHTVTWTPATPAEKGAFLDAGSGGLTYSMVSGTPYSFTTRGYLIVQNPAGRAAGGSASVVRNELEPAAGSPATPPQQLLAAANSSPVVRELAALTGRPQRVSAAPFLREREKTLRAAGLRPPF